MQITAIRVYQVDLPLKDGPYVWSDGRGVSVFDSTVVELLTDSGHAGYGEVCPLGSFYLPAFAAGARAGIGELAPHLLGEDPTNVTRINTLMDASLLGHSYVKSAIDMACWDLLGKRSQLPVCELLGGRQGDSVELYRAIGQQSAGEMAASVVKYRDQGYRKFQLKVGGDPASDIDRIRAVADLLDGGETLVADANTGWRVDDGVRVANALRGLDVYIEQPCASYAHCLSIRGRTALPFILDEVIDSAEALQRALSDNAMDAVNLKISRLGGLSNARVLRDLCVAARLPMTIEDSWGGDIVTAAIAHLAHSTPERLRFSSTDFNSYVSVRNAHGAPQRELGRMRAGTEPGLGVTPDFDALGAAVSIYE